MEARRRSDLSSPMAEIQSLAGVLPTVVSRWMVFWTGFTTFLGGEKEGEEETLSGRVL